eukprot:3628046-Prymnesium_polylepis.1
MRACRWQGAGVFDTVVDLCFIVDMFIKLRTLYKDRGYAVTEPKTVMRAYLTSRFPLDFLGAVPFDDIVLLIIEQENRGGMRSWGTALRMLRLRRCRTLMRQLERSSAANVMQIVALLASFLLLAHWFGLGYFAIAIKPIMVSGDKSHPWFWVDDPNNYVGNTYICAIYWALT